MALTVEHLQKMGHKSYHQGKFGLLADGTELLIFKFKQSKVCLGYH